MKVYKLGVPVKDNISGVQGILTHLTVSGPTNMEYVFQPKSINPSTGTFADIIFLATERINNGILEEVDIPFDVIGTAAEDIATGYKGKIAQLVYHMNGCLHVGLKRPGLNESGNTFPAIEFDIRRLKGPKLKPLSDKKLEDSKKKFPSPISVITRAR